MKQFAKELVKKALRQCGLELHKVSAECPYPRCSLLGALHMVRRLGWRPGTCVDVGAAYGNFTIECAKVFPEAHYLLVEPLAEYEPSLQRLAARNPRVHLARVAAAAQEGQITFHVHKDLVGSSLFREAEGSGVDGVERTVPTATLDQLCQAHQVHGPYLLKLDVQGAELSALQGARVVLQQTEYVILETSLFKFFLDGPQLHDVVAFMGAQGFVPYDVLGLKYRPLDGALAQADIAFVKESGPFRTQHVYATPEQRQEQDTRFLQTLERERRKA